MATPETEAEWIDAVQGKTARVVEAKVARHVRGERPSDEGDPKRVRMRMVLEFTSHQWAIVHRRFAEMRKGDPSL
ncbi:MAG TPA: hypothetical protein VMV18_09775, partial [bacterium]|nr:hypothetical protein [bacterium]